MGSSLSRTRSYYAFMPARRKVTRSLHSDQPDGVPLAPRGSPGIPVTWRSKVNTTLQDMNKKTFLRTRHPLAAGEIEQPVVIASSLAGNSTTPPPPTIVFSSFFICFLVLPCSVLRANELVDQRVNLLLFPPSPSASPIGTQEAGGACLLRLPVYTS